MPAILLCDDSQPFLSALGKLLALHGYDVQTATNGAEALCLMQCRDFGVVVLDLNMSPMSGLEVLGRMTEALSGRLMPAVIVLSGSAGEFPVEVWKPPVRHVIEKPLADENYVGPLLKYIGEIVGPGTAEVPALK